MIAAVIIGMGLVLLISGLRQRRPDGAQQTGKWYQASGMVTVAIGAYILVGAVSYSEICGRYGSDVSQWESEFFAIQTLTTVGYGGGLTVFGPGVSPEFLEAFQMAASVLMIAGSLLWALLIAMFVKGIQDVLNL